MRALTRIAGLALGMSLLAGSALGVPPSVSSLSPLSTLQPAATVLAAPAAAAGLPTFRPLALTDQPSAVQLSVGTTYKLIATPTTNVATTMTTDGSGAPNGTNCVPIADNTGYALQIVVVGKDLTTPALVGAQAYPFVFLYRGTGASTTGVKGGANSTTVPNTYAGSTSLPWAVTIGADTTNGCLALKVTNGNTDSWQWAAIVKQYGPT